MARSTALLAFVVVGIGCGGGAGAAATPPPETVTKAADDFLADMRVGAWNAAFSRLHENMQKACGSAANLKTTVQGSGDHPESWVLREPQVRSRTALLSGQVTTKDGETRSVGLAFERVGDTWQVSTWSAGNRDLCFEPRR